MRMCKIGSPVKHLSKNLGARDKCRVIRRSGKPWKTSQPINPHNKTELMDGGERKGYMTTKIECVQKLYPHFQYVQKKHGKIPGR